MAIGSIGQQTPQVNLQRPSTAEKTSVPVQESVAGPQDTFQASTPAVTGSWLSNQLKNAKPGAMFVLDDFQPTGGQAIPGPFAGPEWMASHGGQVVDTAKQEGFRGQTIPLEINRPLNDTQLQEKYGEMTTLWNEGKTPEDLRKLEWSRFSGGIFGL